MRAARKHLPRNFAPRSAINMYRLLLLSIFLYSLLACNTHSNQDQGESAPISDSLPTQENFNEAPNSIQAEFALWLGGLQSKDTTQAYRDYSLSIEKAWQKVQRSKINPIVSFCDSFLPEHAQIRTLFYPFAGGDFLYAKTFFPTADTIIMVGLEPAGSWFGLDSLSTPRKLNYLSELNRSLFFSNELGFFRTLSMEKELKQPLLDGTLHPILFYLIRLGNRVHKIEKGVLSQEGSLISVPDTLGHQVIRLEYFSSDSSAKKVLYYLSQDLSNAGLKANPGFEKFIRNQADCAVFLKAASYLLHQNDFSGIRNLILEKSHTLLQDDSGIPLKRLRENYSNIKVYGEYTRTIPLFSSFYQEDLKTLFQDSTQVKNPGFIIGYNQKFRQTNLIFAQKMRTL